MTYSAVTHSNYARFGRDLTPLFAINFGALSEAVRVRARTLLQHTVHQNQGPRNFKIHQARLEFYDRSFQYRIVPRINNSISKPEKTHACVRRHRPRRFWFLRFSIQHSCHFIRYTLSPAHHKNHGIITRAECVRNYYGILCIYISLSIEKSHTSVFINHCDFL